MTKEEAISNREIQKNVVFNSHSFAAIGAISPSKDFCLKAMDEWAQMQAIAFAEWIGKVVNKEIVVPGNPQGLMKFEELYNLFIQDQNK